jgi:TatD DNase family protein
VYGDDAGVDAAVERAKAAGVDRMITIGAGYGVAGMARAVGLAERHPGSVRATVGVHPHDAKECTDGVLAQIERFAAHPMVVAIGELGLDFHYDLSERDTQRAVLRDQLRLALRLGLPVVVHDRESDGETLRILEEEGSFAAGVLFHCYTGSVPMMERIVACGGYVSIPGIVTFKKAGDVAEVARVAPLARILVETDSPFLTPVPHRGKRNEPALVPLVARCVAALRGLPVDELVAATDANAARLYGWDYSVS